MRLTTLKAAIIIVATLTALLFTALSYFISMYTTLFFSLEVILLPAIYIVGNRLAEQKIQEQYRTIITRTEQDLKELHEKYYIQLLLNRELQSKSEKRKEQAP